MNVGQLYVTTGLLQTWQSNFIPSGSQVTFEGTEVVEGVGLRNKYSVNISQGKEYIFTIPGSEADLKAQGLYLDKVD